MGTLLLVPNRTWGKQPLRRGCTFCHVPRTRIDTLLAERGLARSRASAAESVRAGRVRIGRDGPAARRPCELVADDAELVVAEPQPYVSRGGVKLANALEALGLDVAGRGCLDVGASTGGFTDCLLQAGAARVIALDVGHGQLDWSLRNDERVAVIERSNARELDPGTLPFAPQLAHRRRLLHRAGQGAACDHRVPRRRGRPAGAGEAAVRARPRADRPWRRRPRCRRPARGAARRRRCSRRGRPRRPRLRLLWASRPEGQPRDLHLGAPPAASPSTSRRAIAEVEP